MRNRFSKFKYKAKNAKPQRSRVRDRYSYDGYMNSVIALRILDLKPPITKEIIKNRYRELVVRWHSDKQLGDTRIMQSINAARDYLNEIVQK